MDGLTNEFKVGFDKTNKRIDLLMSGVFSTDCVATPKELEI